MTIYEAIEHAEERACGNDQCAKDHAQLADWLRELRQARIDIEVLKIFRDGFKEDAQKYKAENARLRELVSDMWTCISECEYGDCSYCSRLDSCVGGISEFSDRMTEVGIEVPEWKVPHERDNHLIRENRNLKSCIRGLAESLSTFESEFNKMSARVSELAGDDDMFTLNAMDIWRQILNVYGIELKT